MVKWISLLLLFVMFASGIGPQQDFRTKVEVYETFEDLESIIDAGSDQVWIINFWATSCPPCLKEMPHFAELNRKYPADKVKVLLISLDDKKHLDTRVLPFMKKHKITPKVILLADQNYSTWTDKIDTSWYGALPATLIRRGNLRNFRFGAYATYDELVNDLDSMLK